MTKTTTDPNDPIDSIDPMTATTLRQEPHRDRMIGRRLRSIRESAHVTHADIEALTGLPMTCLAEHEAGEIPLPISRVHAIASVLGIRPMELFVRLIFPGS